MMNEALLLVAFRAMDELHKRHAVAALQALAKDYPAPALPRLRLVTPNAVAQNGLGQRPDD